ncbi:MAG: DinB family protein, partial [Dehalococcoidia bacterium]
MSQDDPPADHTYTPAAQIRYWLEEERRRFLTAVAGLSEAAAQEPLEPGGWSVHDILAHRLFWEGREVEALGQYLLGKRVELLDFPLKRVDGTNARAVATLQGHTSARLLRELRQTRAMLMELLAKVPDADLNSA